MLITPALSPTAGISLAGALLLAIGGVMSIRRETLRAGLLVQAAGALALGVAGAAVFAGAEAIGSDFRSELVPSLGIDRLSGFFLLLLASVAVPACACASDTLSRDGGASTRAIGALTAVFVLALVGVVTARDAVTFLGAWELMTLAPAAAILVARPDPHGRRTVFVYLAITHLGGAGVWIAMLLLADAGALGGSPLSGTAATLATVAALIGFATKAGLVPLHAWLPRAHPLAPSHLSALMSGAMVAIALYGLVRVLFEWIEPAGWVGAVLIGLGVASALSGALHAAVQRELKRLLALSTIENMGIATATLGAALLLDAADAPRWAAIAFAAALLCLLAHALAKGLLFLSAGAMSNAVGSLELDSLGGLGRRMPWTSGAFAIGALSVAGMAPLAGFVAEWSTLQALVALAHAGPEWMVAAAALAVAGIAATAALAVFAFVKAIGLALLGEPRRETCAAAVDAPPVTRHAQAALAAGGIALALAAGPMLSVLAELAPGARPIAIGPDLALPGTGGLPIPALAIALIAVTCALALLAARGRRTAPTPAWTCGQDVGPELRWTSAGFGKLLTLTTAPALRPQRELTVEADSGGAVERVAHHSEIPRLLDSGLYLPILRTALSNAARMRRLQSGSLQAYLLYLLALVAGLLALIRIGALG